MSAPRGRAPGFKMPEEHRLKIANSNILSALIAHVVDGKEMSPSQVTAGLGLLKKVMPDLQATTLSGEEGAPAIKLEIGWKSSTSKSTTSPEPSSKDITTDQNDGPVSLRIVEPAKR